MEKVINLFLVEKQYDQIELLSFRPQERFQLEWNQKSIKYKFLIANFLGEKTVLDSDSTKVMGKTWNYCCWQRDSPNL